MQLQFRKIVESNLKKYGYDLTEAKQVGTLYHTTSIYGLLGIIKDNYIESQRYNGISFSRDKNNWYNKGLFTLVLNGDKISENNKTYPFSFHSYFPNQYPGKDTNSETTVLPRGMKPDPRFQDEDGEWSGIDEIIGLQNFQLKNINKYIEGLLINEYLLKNDIKEVEFQIEQLKFDHILPNNFEYTIENVLNYCISLFKKQYPNAFIKYSNHKPYDRHQIYNHQKIYNKE